MKFSDYLKEGSFGGREVKLDKNRLKSSSDFNKLVGDIQKSFGGNIIDMDLKGLKFSSTIWNPSIDGVESLDMSQLSTSPEVGAFVRYDDGTYKNLNFLKTSSVVRGLKKI